MNVSDSAFKSERHGVRGPSSAYAASGCARGWLPRLKARDASGGRTLRGGAGGSCSRWSTSWPCARSGGGGRMRPGVAGGGAASWGQGPPPASCRRLEGCPAAASAAAGSSTSSRRHGLPFLPRVESTPPPTFQVVNAADSLFRLLFFTNPDAPTYITASAQNLSAPASRRCFFPSPPPPRPPPPASVSLSSWSAKPGLSPIRWRERSRRPDGDCGGRGGLDRRPCSGCGGHGGGCLPRQGWDGGG